MSVLFSEFSLGLRKESQKKFPLRKPYIRLISLALPVPAPPSPVALPVAQRNFAIEG